MSGKDLAIATRRLSAALLAGRELPSATQEAAEACHSSLIKNALREVAESLRTNSEPLSAVLQRHVAALRPLPTRVLEWSLQPYLKGVGGVTAACQSAATLFGRLADIEEGLAQIEQSNGQLVVLELRLLATFEFWLATGVPLSVLVPDLTSANDPIDRLRSEVFVRAYNVTGNLFEVLYIAGFGAQWLADYRAAHGDNEVRGPFGAALGDAIAQASAGPKA